MGRTESDCNGFISTLRVSAGRLNLLPFLLTNHLQFDNTTQGVKAERLIGIPGCPTLMFLEGSGFWTLASTPGLKDRSALRRGRLIGPPPFPHTEEMILNGGNVNY